MIQKRAPTKRRIRKNDEAPTSLLDRFLDPVATCFTPRIARRLVNLRADQVTQKRLDELADKANEGELTEAERDEYEVYVHAINFISILQAKARRYLKTHADA